MAANGFQGISIDGRGLRIFALVLACWVPRVMLLLFRLSAGLKGQNSPVMQTWVMFI